MSLILDKCLKKPNSAGRETLTFPMSRQPAEEEIRWAGRAEAAPVWDGLHLSECMHTHREAFTRACVFMREWFQIWVRKYKQHVKAQKSDDTVESLYIHNTNPNALFWPEHPITAIHHRAAEYRTVRGTGLNSWTTTASRTHRARTHSRHTQLTRPLRCLHALRGDCPFAVCILKHK